MANSRRERDFNPDERVAIPLDPETALRGLMQVSPEEEERQRHYDEKIRCRQRRNGKRCYLASDHVRVGEPHEYED